MDHSYSIDTCLYNSGSLSKMDSTGLKNHKNEDESKLARTIEEELGLASAYGENKTSGLESKIDFLKKWMDSFSKLKLSERMSVLKNYLDFKSEFEYSESSVEADGPKASKTEENGKFSAPVTKKKFGSARSEAKKAKKKGATTPVTPIMQVTSITPTSAASTPRSAAYATLDKKTLEKVFVLFVETTNKLAKKAVENNQHVLTDKLLCNMFKMLQEAYAEDYVTDYTESLDAQGIHPLFNVDFNIPPNTPDVVREKVEKLAKDETFRETISEKVYMFQFIEKFKLLDLHKLCLSHRHSMVTELWNLCFDTVVNKRSHDWDKVYRCRNLVFEGSGKIKLPTDLRHLDAKLNSDDMSQFSDSASSKMTSENNLADMERYGVQSEDVAGYEDMDIGKSKDKWIKEVYISNSRVLNYIVNTNRMLEQERVEILKGHFNFTGTREPGTWVREPNNQLPTYCLIEKKAVNIKIRGKLPCDIITALSIISDSELATEWVPFSKDSKDLKIFTKTSRIFKQVTIRCYAQINVYDYPVIGHKETVFHGISTNLLDEANCVIISCSNPPASKKEAEYVMNAFKQGGVEKSNYLRVDSNYNFAISGYMVSKVQKKNQKSGDILFILFPYSEEETLMEAYGNVIQDVKIVPMKFVVFIAKKMILGMFRKVSRICKNFKDSKFAKSVEDRSDFCTWMNGVYREYKVNNPQTFVTNQPLATYTYSLSSGRRKFK
ncbi:conserved hypothetical protein [Theileria orientalis strain Shintoku]|uniref:START domain-containing protein n=1 Tax=Theileria orientalis strain Shintoku TaxID=869250 RepID=J4CCK3_THEOR|nr:conserved hypothetical protein [Theileria orientalis strain Shintoku]BAM39542.1 conserved hypothetical protein [Theileria orientalis strain Shintoku]|eukprot:XP_009689843.1 conserved hypothetical protein [Theileria orientalis strain Shintoku]